MFDLPFRVTLSVSEVLSSEASLTLVLLNLIRFWVELDIYLQLTFFVHQVLIGLLAKHALIVIGLVYSALLILNFLGHIELLRIDRAGMIVDLEHQVWFFLELDTFTAFVLIILTFLFFFEHG